MAIPANFKGTAARLTDIDLPRVGAKIGVGEDEIHAVMEVESRGYGFDKQGRPLPLFEPHVFYRELGPGAKRNAAVRAGLAYFGWKPGQYPDDSYPRILAAMAIDRVAALRSTSWGLGQVMGFNHIAAGYGTVEAFVAAMCESEGNQLDAMISFIKTNRLDDEIRDHNWTKFALGYNGTDYRKNDYDGRLARAFARWKRIPDTKWTPELAMRESAGHGEIIGDARRPSVNVSKPVTPAALPPPPDIPKPMPPAPAPRKGFWSWLGSAFTPKQKD